MAYDPTDARWREYHVTPRYLAGPTDTGEPALRPLLDRGSEGLMAAMNTALTDPAPVIR